MNIIDLFDSEPAALKKRFAGAANQCITSAMLERLIDLGLLSDYLDGNEKAKEAEQAYYEEQKQNSCKTILEKYPPLCMLLNTIRENYAAAEKEFRTRFAQEDLGTLISVTPDMGDCHNKGRTTCIVLTDRGKYVYKPHDMRIDALLIDFFDRFFPDTVKLPKVLVRNGYGFAEFMENRPASTMDEARAYYRRMGVFTVVLKILCGTDMHVENLLAQGEYPVPIDLETLMNPAFVQKNSIFADIQLSNMMPSKLSGMEISPLFSDGEDNVSAPVVNGKKLIVSDCLDNFLQGYEQAYRSCMERAHAIKEYLRKMPVVTVRVIPRGTQAYYNLYLKTCSPGWLKDPKLRQSMRSALAAGMEFMPEQILQSEIDALLCGDIPYFCTDTDSTLIMGESGILAKSCIQNASDRIDSLSEKDLRFQMGSFLRMARPTPIRSKTTEAADRAIALFDTLEEDILETPDGSLQWLEYNNVTPRLLSSGLIDGLSGIALFASAMYKATGRKSAEKLRDRLLAQILSDLPRLNNASWAVGFGGIAHAALMMPEAPLSHDLLEEIIRLLPRVDLSSLDSDEFHGLSGVLIAICEMNDPRLEELKHSVSRMLIAKRDGYWKTINNHRFLSGFGHGHAGIAYALNRAGYAEEARPAYDFELENYSEKLRGWPDLRDGCKPGKTKLGYCSGAPGIGLVALRLGEECNLERAINSCLEHAPLDVDHLCCGNCASIDFLLEAGTVLGRPELIHAAREKMKALTITDSDSMYSLFYGLAGIGYTLLRCIDPKEIPSPILLP